MSAPATTPGSRIAAASAHTELRSMWGVSSERRRNLSTPSEASVLMAPQASRTTTIPTHWDGRDTATAPMPAVRAAAAPSSTRTTTSSTLRGSDQTAHRRDPIGLVARPDVPLARLNLAVPPRTCPPSGWNPNGRTPATNALRNVEAMSSRVDAGNGTEPERCVARGGVEPPTYRFSGGRSYQLSYLAGPTCVGHLVERPRRDSNPRPSP